MAALSNRKDSSDFECSDILRYAAEGVMRSELIFAKMGTRFGGLDWPDDFDKISLIVSKDG